MSGTTAYRYWGLQIMCSPGADFTILAGITFSKYIGGPNAATNSTLAHDTANYGGGYVGAMAFDNNPNTFYAVQSSVTNPIVYYDFTQPVLIGAFTAQSENNSGRQNAAPQTMALVASNDGSTWTTIQTYTPSQPWTASQIQSFTVTGGPTTAPPPPAGITVAPARYWGLRMQATLQSDGYVIVAGIEFAASTGGQNLAVASAGTPGDTSDVGGGDTAASAFDGNSNTIWAATYNPNVEPIVYFDFGANPQAIYEVRVAGENGNRMQDAPAIIQLVSSPDGSTWTTIYDFSTDIVTPWPVGGVQTFDVPGASASPAYVPGTPHRYWGVTCAPTGVNGNPGSAPSYLAFANITLASEINGDNLATNPGSAYATSTANSMNEPSNAISPYTGEKWTAHGSGPDTWFYDFGANSPQNIESISITCSPGQDSFAPYSIELVYSDDGVNFTNVQGFTAGPWQDNTPQTFSVTGAGSGPAPIAAAQASQLLVETIGSNTGLGTEVSQALIETVAYDPNNYAAVSNTYMEAVWKPVIAIRVVHWNGFTVHGNLGIK